MKVSFLVQFFVQIAIDNILIIHSFFNVARAKIIAAQGEKEASVALKEASDVISQSGAALQLRYLQTLNNIAQEKNSTIIFPIPGEIMRGIFGSSEAK